VVFSLRLEGSGASVTPVATGAPGREPGYRCANRRSPDWPGYLQDAVFLVPPDGVGHTVVITGTTEQRLVLGA
jgi:hypothetical protein